MARRTHPVSLRLPPEVQEQIEKLSEETGLGFRTLVQMCLEAGLASWEANAGRLIVPLQKDDSFRAELRRQSQLPHEKEENVFRYQQKVAEEPIKASRRKKGAPQRSKSDHHQLPEHDSEKPA